MKDDITPFNYMSGRPTFKMMLDHTWNLFLSRSHRVDVGRWQGVDTEGKPDLSTYELMNYTFTQDLKSWEDLDWWRRDIKPNLPWADDHFEERVCGYPINPGTEWANWPWGDNAAKFLDANGKFNHNYMERYWPRYASREAPKTKTGEEWAEWADQQEVDRSSAHGIRGEYGDLNDLVASLAQNPQSRQEWFPIFHPEDVGEVVGGRKPCSLGYQFWVRGDQLHVYYLMRSCDFFRHMRDDIYLTIRLLLWVLNQCRLLDHPACGYWNQVTPGTFTMHCTSLHVFANDMVQMKKEGPKS